MGRSGGKLAWWVIPVVVALVAVAAIVYCSDRRADATFLYDEF